MAERGRPSTFSREKADEILARVASGETLRQVCRDEEMPPESTVRQWALSDVDGFAAQYARARELQMEAWADETIDIADDARNDWIERENARTGAAFIALNEEAVSRARIRIDQRKWLMSKWKPSQYGDKVQVAGEIAHRIERVERRIVDPKAGDPDSEGVRSAS